MLIIGAKGHAKEMIEVLRENDEFQPIHFFDNITNSMNMLFYGYPIVKDFDDVVRLFNIDKRFSIAIGKPSHRFELTSKFIILGGVPTSIVSNMALVSNDSDIKIGVNIMPFASIYNNTIIGEGSLINSYASVHHDSHIGDYCEISPGARILGGCKIGNLCSIGTNAVILPTIKVVDNVIIGAGSVVTKDINEPGVYYGVPVKRFI